MSLPSEEAHAQCSFGATPLYNDCFGITWEGCCTYKESEVGTITTLQWCENGYLCSLICNPFNYDTALCGWVTDPGSGLGLYDCTTAQGQDPSGQFPYFCQIPCGNITSVGCCEGQTLLKNCKDGSLNLINCSANAEGARFCGWDPVLQAYTCTHAAIEGPAQHPYTCGATTCTPECSGKQCGPDGCGGSCGSCGADQYCNAQGACEGSGCQPQCDNKDCGPDGCGGSCGTCGANLVCNLEQLCAAPPCKPDCTNKQCGPDLCGGSCGACVPPKLCSAFFQCVDPGDDVTLLPDAVDAQTVPDTRTNPNGTPEDVSQINLDTRKPGGCPDGFVSSYGKCVNVPSSNGDGDPDGCAASAFRGDRRLSGLVLVVLAFLLFSWSRRKSEVVP